MKLQVGQTMNKVLLDDSGWMFVREVSSADNDSGVSGQTVDIACEVSHLYPRSVTHDTAHHLYLALSGIMQLPWLSEISIMNHMHVRM